MSEQHPTKQVLNDALTDDALTVVVGGTDGAPGGPGEGTSAR